MPEPASGKKIPGAEAAPKQAGSGTLPTGITIWHNLPSARIPPKKLLRSGVVSNLCEVFLNLLLINYFLLPLFESLIE